MGKLLRLLSSNEDGDWLRYVKENLEKDEWGVSETNSDTCMVGVGNPFLRFLKPEAYTPQVISIGPCHHKSVKQYEETDGYKLKMAKALEREFPGFKIRTLVDYIKSSDEQIRDFHDRNISYSDEVLSWMLALDTSFVLQFLNSIYRPDTLSIERTKELDPILLSKKKTSFWYAMTSDILMLENQVPMFLLIQVLSLTTKPDTPMVSPNHRDMARGFATMYLEGERLAEILQASTFPFYIN
ncbi:hypothetical protein SUGI_0844120 [Cryptomeria japonica]|nr:hypothetical protein SUGI_0844120 [Cryptomeria japonica]